MSLWDSVQAHLLPVKITSTLQIPLFNRNQLDQLPKIDVRICTGQFLGGGGRYSVDIKLRNRSAAVLRASNSAFFNCLIWQNWIYLFSSIPCKMQSRHRTLYRLENVLANSHMPLVMPITLKLSSASSPQSLAPSPTLSVIHYMPKLRITGLGMDSNTG